MRKRNIGFQLVLLVLLFTFPAMLQAQEALTQTFTSSDGLITISYPDGWSAEEEDGLIRLSSDQAFMQINWYDYGKEVTSQEILDIGASVDYGFSPSESVIVAGYAALQARSEDQFHTIINFCDGVQALAIGFTNFGEVPTYEPTFTAILDTLRYGEGEPQVCRGAFEGMMPITPTNAAQVAQLATFGDEASAVESVAFSPDGNVLAAGTSDGSVRTWSMVTGEELWSLNGFAGGATSLAFGRGGYNLAVGTGIGIVRMVDAASGASSGFLQTHTDAVESVAFGGDGFLIASGSLDGSVGFWDMIAYSTREPLSDADNPSPVTSIAFTPDGGTLAAGGGSTIRLWDIATGTVLAALETEISDISSLSFRPDGALLVYGGADPTAWVWDVANNLNQPLLEGHTDQVLALAFSPDGSMIVSGDAGTVRLWDAATGANLAALTGDFGQTVNSVAFSPSGTVIASAGELGGVVLWGTASAGGQPQEAAASDSTGEIDTSTEQTTSTGETTTTASTCTITASNNINLRSGAGTNFDRAGGLSGGQSADVDGQAQGADGMTWYRLTSGAWVRSDIVGSPAACAGVPVVTP